MKALLPIMVLVAATATVAFFVVDPLEEEGYDYKQANRHLFEELTHPHGTEVAQIKDQPYFAERGPILSKEPIGWTLNATLRPPAGMTMADILAYYENNAPDGWRLSVEDSPHIDLASGHQVGTSRIFTYSRASSLVSLNFDNLDESGVGTYEIAVDHNARR